MSNTFISQALSILDFGAKGTTRQGDILPCFQAGLTKIVGFILAMKEEFARIEYIIFGRISHNVGKSPWLLMLKVENK
jgi:hypothetical protein